MKRFLCILLLGFCFLALPSAAPAPWGGTAYAQQGFNLQRSIKRLKANPRYRGRVLGTRVVRTREGRLVEVRILRPNDRIIIVYIDPQTGGVVGDSGS